MSYIRKHGKMKSVSAREANHGFSELLSQVEQGKEILITRHGKPVAIMSPYRAPSMTKERKRSIDQAVALMEIGLPWGSDFKIPPREEMHDR